MRVAVGLAAVVEGGAYLSGRDTAVLLPWLTGLLALTAGSALLIGLLTPVASILVGIGSAAVALSSFPIYPHDLLHNGSALIFMLVMTAAQVLLGPGAYSLDARLFGRREVIIPKPPAH